MEILVIAVVALIVFGPEKLPEMARKTGRFVSDIRRMSSDVRSEFETAFDDEDEDDDFEPARGPRRRDEKSGGSGEASEKEAAPAATESSGTDKPAPG